MTTITIPGETIVIPAQTIKLPDRVITIPDPVTPGTTRRKFSPTSFYNTRLTEATPINFNSAGMVAELVSQSAPGLKTPYYPALNTVSYSTPVYIVKDVTVPKILVPLVKNGVKVGEPLPARIPGNVTPSSGTDAHCVIWDQVDDTLTEFWQLTMDSLGWHASWGGYMMDVSNASGIFPDPYGATATGLSLLGGLILLSELEAGVIPHVIGMAIPQGPNKWVWPANRTDKNVVFYEGTNAIPAGTRFRFPSNLTSIDPTWVPIVRMIVAAIRDYGCVVQDRAGALSLYAENTLPLGQGDQIRTKFFGGKEPWSFMQQIPWSKMQVLK